MESLTSKRRSRREVLRFAGILGVGVFSRSAMSAQEARSSGHASEVDHLALGTKDLDAGIHYVENLTGVRPSFGGRHAGQGTKNALLSLGPRQYLEIIAPDPDQPDADGALVTSLRRLDSPAVTGWAAALTGIDRLATRLRSNGYNVPKVLLTERPQQDGKLVKLRWFDITGISGGVVPWPIEWDAKSAHGSEGAAEGCRIEKLELEHPEYEKMNRVLELLGLRSRVRSGPTAKVTAWLASPKGEVPLTS